jgi:polyisoprenyl-teichoic acid--peptidoglycan teichoic acid transferase
MKKFTLLVIIFIFILSGCSSAPAQQQAPTVIPITALLLNQDPNLPPTLTPFQPIPPTPTKTLFIPTATILPTGTPVPTAQYTTYPTLANPNISTPTGQIKILLLGSDYRPGRGFRTDVIILLVLNPQAGTATMTSFPRDLYISIPGIGMERINTAQEYGGFALTSATFQQNFGFTPDYYVMTNFDGFKNIVDTLGGIDVNAAITFSDQCSVRSRVDGHGNCTIYAGMNHMDGETALWYARSRYTSSDFDRTRRAQEVIQAIFLKLMSMGAANHASDLYSEFNSSVETNLQLSTLISLIPLASQLANDTSRIRRYAIGSSDVYNYVVPGSGAMVLVPDQNAVMSIIYQALSQ